MQVVFVGGAHHVGASCLAIQLAEQWVVVDAGVRVDRQADPLPDLALLSGKDIRAILVTHAHADHIGALPLVHQSFPHVPIFTSRATSLLMEVMLADAFKVMEKRAAQEMELPMYPEALISQMLQRVRPMPVGSSFSLPELRDITIATSVAGHIAGAVGISLSAPDGSIVVSGDISITPQRTVQGAEIPKLKRPDLLVLESTYGARMHANRQAEELRLAQAVAEGIAGGGHVLIPAFGLGRGQEVLLILQAAQEKGQIPLFPIYVDGLIRRVCYTYELMPEALSPLLQRQIRKGYAPFTSGKISFVRDERQREQILAGPPACIVSSSGMLTGGPSVWYAQRLVERADCSIFITGYQDEEAPGRRLLDLAEKKEKTLVLDGKPFEVRCQFAKYSLSAHADGNELSTYASVLQPKRVALVHGDDDSRAALRKLLPETEVMLPVDGEPFECHKKASSASKSEQSEKRVPSERIFVKVAPNAIGEGFPFTAQDIEQLWRAVRTVPSMRIATIRELATIWYGEAREEQMIQMRMLLDDDWDQRFFIRQQTLEEAYRVRGPKADDAPGHFLAELNGKVLLLLLSQENTKPVICRGVDLGASIQVLLPRGIGTGRNRYSFSSIFDILGPAPNEHNGSQPRLSSYLLDLIKESRKLRRRLSAHELAKRCQEGGKYALGELCQLAGVEPNALADRLAVGKLVHQHPELFIQQETVLSGEGLALYSLVPEWREGLLYPEKKDLPDQNEILRTIEMYVGNPPDLHRRSVNPETGDVILHFFFPEVAEREYASAIAEAAAEAGVSITISPNTRQEQLVNVARRILPQGIKVRGNPSIHIHHKTIEVACTGEISAEALKTVQTRFTEETGWSLELSGHNLLGDKANSKQEKGNNKSNLRTTDTKLLIDNGVSTPDKAGVELNSPVNQQEALTMAQQMLQSLDGCYKIGVDGIRHTILVRFHFPDVAEKRYEEILSTLADQSGWEVQLHPSVHQQALIDLVYQLIPDGLVCKNTPSIHQAQQKVIAICTGSADDETIAQAQASFTEQTGWDLALTIAPS